MLVSTRSFTSANLYCFNLIECNCTVGLGRCFGPDFNDQTCCNYFNESSCVENCPLGQVSGTNFVCGKFD